MRPTWPTTPGGCCWNWIVTSRAPRRSPRSVARRSMSSRPPRRWKSSIDLPGVPAESIRVAFRRNTLLVVGAKVAEALPGSTRFHLAERSYGRFARAIRLTGALDASRARAVSDGGELRVTVPRLDGSARPCLSSCRWSADDPSALHRRHRRQARPRAGPSRARARSSRTTTSISSSRTSRTRRPGSASRPTSRTICSRYGVHVMTGGNHTWDKKEIVPYFADQPRLLRPANFPRRHAGPRRLRRARDQRRAGGGRQRRWDASS